MWVRDDNKDESQRILFLPLEASQSRTVDDLLLKEEGDGDEEEVEDEHDHGHADVQAPVEGGNGEDDKEQHKKEEDDRADHAFGDDAHVAKDAGVHEPGQRKSVWGDQGEKR